MKKLLLPLLMVTAFAVDATTDFTGVADTAIPAVVSIKTKQQINTQSDFEEFFGPNDFFRHFFEQPRQQSPQIGQGSGFLISSDGFIVTNSHVVNEASEITVTLNDTREFSATLKGCDPNTDIALIKIDALDLPFLTFADSEAIKVGQPVAAIGTPLGLHATMTSGIISAKGRNNLDITRVEDFIQTDAPINRGNSGGPLLNLDAQVIGMNTAIVSPTGGNMGLGFAIPSNMMQHVVAQIQDTGSVSRGFMGVVLQQVDKDLATAFNMKEPTGALVAELAPDSPAKEAGIEQGDVLLKYNTTQIKNVASLRNAISMMHPGTTLNFTVQRGEETLQIPVTIGEFPGDEEKSAPHETTLGLHVEKSDLGVVVSKVETGSLAALAGIKKGAIIQEVNRTKVQTVDEFKKALKATDASKPTLLLIKQGDVTRYVSLRG